MDAKVSVIIPIYNGYQYLPRLLDCLLNQTFQNIEVILIDDYSTDESFTFLSEKIKNNSKFKLLRPEKKGGTAAINIEYALKHVTGDYYFYMSQDDFMDYDCIEKCVLKAEAENADIVIPNCILFYNDKKQMNQSLYPLDGNYNQILNNIEAFNLSINWKIHGFTLRKVYLFEKTGFDGKYFNSDELYVRYHYLIANKICFCDTNFYYFQANENAITKRFSYRFVDILTTQILLFHLAEGQKLNEEILHNIYKSVLSSFVYYSVLLKLEKINPTEREYYNKSLDYARNEIRRISSDFGKGSFYLLFIPLEIRLRIIYKKIKKLIYK